MKGVHFYVRVRAKQQAVGSSFPAVAVISKPFDTERYRYRRIPFANGLASHSEKGSLKHHAIH